MSYTADIQDKVFAAINTIDKVISSLNHSVHSYLI